MLHRFHPGRALLLAMLLHGAAHTAPASAQTIRVWPGVTGSTSLESLWSRPLTTQTVPVGAAAVASKSNPNTVPNAAAMAPFAARRARIESARRPVDPAAVLAEGDALRARLSRFRRSEPHPSSSPTSAAATDAPLLRRQTDARIVRHEGRAIFMAGENLGLPASTPQHAAAQDVATAAAEGFWERWAPLLALDTPVDELQLVATQTDALGQTHLRYQQVYRGLEVWARDAWVHVHDGMVIAFNGRLAPSPRGLDVTPRFPAPAAGPAACASVEATVSGNSSQPRVTASASATDLVVFAREAQPLLAWKVRVQAGLDVVEDVFVDAQSGRVLHSTSLVTSDGPVSGSGIDLSGSNRNLDLYQVGADYFNINAAKPMWNPASNPPQTVKGGIRVLDARNGGDGNLFFSVSNNPNDWTGKANQVSAAANASLVYDYYNTRHGRNSIDGVGGTMELVVNFKSNFNNAFWNGQLMVFGNGDGNAFSDLAAALDATGHEMSHGVVERTANLIYEFQSGALNESFADVFGTAAEFFATPGTANFLIAESITTPGTPGDALRNLEDPGAANVAFGGQQPGNMSQYRDLPITEDKGGVHINSGIPNRAFHLVATHAALGATAAERMSKAERIYYRALTMYLTRSAQFIDCRLAVIRAAEDLYGGGSAVAQACAQAFDAVGLGTGEPSEPPPTLPPVAGEEWLTATEPGTGRLVRFPPDLSVVQPVSSIGVLNKPTLTDNGQTMIFVDAAHQLRIANSNGSNEQVLSTQTVWWNVSLSPDGHALAATTTAFDGRIYIFDLTNPANDRFFEIYSQNYGGEGDNAARFADVLDFSNDGQFVMYDAFNIVALATGDTLAYWDINVMRAEDGDVTRVFPPQTPGINLGNPTFSRSPTPSSPSTTSMKRATCASWRRISSKARSVWSPTISLPWDAPPSHPTPRRWRITTSIPQARASGRCRWRQTASPGPETTGRSPPAASTPSGMPSGRGHRSSFPISPRSGRGKVRWWSGKSLSTPSLLPSSSGAMWAPDSPPAAVSSPNPCAGKARRACGASRIPSPTSEPPPRCATRSSAGTATARRSSWVRSISTPAASRAFLDPCVCTRTYRIRSIRARASPSTSDGASAPASRSSTLPGARSGRSGAASPSPGHTRTPGTVATIMAARLPPGSTSRACSARKERSCRK